MLIPLKAPLSFTAGPQLVTKQVQRKRKTLVQQSNRSVFSYSQKGSACARTRLSSW